MHVMQPTGMQSARSASGLILIHHHGTATAAGAYSWHSIRNQLSCTQAHMRLHRSSPPKLSRQITQHNSGRRGNAIPGHGCLHTWGSLTCRVWSLSTQPSNRNDICSCSLLGIHDGRCSAVSHRTAGKAASGVATTERSKLKTSVFPLCEDFSFTPF